MTNTREPPRPATRAGGVDWAARWQAMLDAAEAPAQGVVDDDPWRLRARRFDRLSRRSADRSLDALAEGLLSTDTLADLGAGAGRHAVPLSRLVARTLAVEPSHAMRERLSARVAEERSRVTVVATSWPCDLEPVDVSYSCHVLYGVRDPVRFLDAMTESTRRTCRLLLGLEAPADRLAPLFAAIHGRPRGPRPAALEALALLHQHGKPASLRVLPGTARPMTYAPARDDLDELCHRLRLPVDDASRARVVVALDACFPRESGDAPWDLGDGRPAALIEWPGEAPS